MKGSVIIAMKNDERVLLLKKQIDEKRNGLAAQKFSPKTNCIIDLDGQKYNINVLQVNELELLLVKLSVYSEFAKNLGFELTISGYAINEWITDINQKLAVIKDKKKRDELKELESKLDKLLSDEKKTELILDEIAASLM